MDISRQQIERNSEQDFLKKFATFVDCGAGVLQVRTSEPLRAATAIRKWVITNNNDYKEWDIVNGFRTFQAHQLNQSALAGDGNLDVNTVFSEPLAQFRAETNNQNANADRDRLRFFLYMDLQMFMENNPPMRGLLTLYNNVLPSSNISIILITPDVPLPIQDLHVFSLAFDTPGPSELRQSLLNLLNAEDVKESFKKSTLDDDELDRICNVAAGMPLASFEAYTALSLVEMGEQKVKAVSADEVVKTLSIGKTDLVNSSDILELYPQANIEDVGGMENLKDWVQKRALCYSDEAKEFGIQPPKGMVFVGPPGTGKSLVAKAVSGVLGVPLVRLDFGRIFNSLVGASEQRMRSALRMVEQMSPVVLFCDEVDKGLGGIGGSSDGGVSNRVLGSFLTWLNDCKYPVFTIVTANNVTHLPPELMRRGRFDAIFSTTLPPENERLEVLRIHLRQRGRDIDDFTPDEVADAVRIFDRYVPAEIESAVKDALIDAFSAGEPFSMRHVIEAASHMVPLSKAFATQIGAMQIWAENNATPASRTADNIITAAANAPNARRINRRSRVQ